MKSLRLHGRNDLRLHDEPIPTAKPGESLLRITAVGICGSDLHWFDEGGIGDAQLEMPLVLGHEFAAIVVGSGQRVAVEPAVACELCEFCLEGNPNLCINHYFSGHGRQDGAFRDYMAWPDKCLFPLPDSLSDADGAMLEPLGVAIHAVDLVHIKPGMTVGVYGCGPIGLLILQMARLAGATTMIATDKLTHRLAAAKALGATAVFQAHLAEESQAILALTHGRGVDVAFEAAGENSAVDTAVATLKPGGHLILAGIPADDRTSFNASTARRKGLTIKIVRRMKHTYPRAISLVAAGLVDVRSLVTHRFGLDEFNTAFATAQRREGLKVIIELGGNG